ncbi:MAG TPA: hypothetical protein VJU59_13625 [Paraburkholderia sp.]|uniref:hypothetical protein n=1 Tax=Paraburkholderia sp. TaxID=1926495 RepID=UPI002B49BE2C|nr:hypothetical protein [Paraburkholderia sp.]HKR40695.1 hypothetical protein [Paraburkholderia sp.]
MFPVGGNKPEVFGAVTSQQHALRGWLLEQGAHSVAMNFGADCRRVKRQVPLLSQGPQHRQKERRSRLTAAACRASGLTD